METIRDIIDGYICFGDIGNGVARGRENCSWLHWFCDTVTGLAAIRNTVAGLLWSGNTGTGEAVIRNIVAFTLVLCGIDQGHCCFYTGLVWH